MTKTAKVNIVDSEVAKKINSAFKGLENGRINLIVKDSKVVKIDVSEKTHRDDIWIFGEGEGI